jgi:hypothetical protein
LRRIRRLRRIEHAGELAIGVVSELVGADRPKAGEDGLCG